MKKIIIICVIGWVLIFFSSGEAFCGSGCCSVEKGACVAGSTTDSAKEAVQDAVAADTTVKPVMNTICPVMGVKIDPTTLFFVEYQGKKIGLCCEDCIKAFNAEPEKYMKKVEEELQAAKTAGTEKKEETAVKTE